MLVVQPDVALERGFQIRAALEVMASQHFGDTAVEAFGHAVGLGPADRRQTVFDAQGRAELIKLVLAGSSTLARGEEPVGEFLAVIGEVVRM